MSGDDQPPNGKPSALVAAFSLFRRMFADAVRLEWQTDAGKVNFYGMVLAFFIVVVTSVTGGVQWTVEVLLAAFGRGDGPSGMNPIDTIWIFLIWSLGCVLMLGLLVVRARKNDPPEEA